MTQKEPTQESIAKVRDTVQRLSDVIDPIGLREYIIKRTPRGKSSNPDPWGYTREALAKYSAGSDPDEVIKLFEAVGCKNELEAVRWIIRYDDYVP